MITNRGAAALLVAALALTGCGSSTAPAPAATTSSATESASPTTTAQPKTANANEPVLVSTKYGDLEISVEKFVDYQWAYDQYQLYDPISEGKRVGVLVMKVRNVSYSDPYNQDYVSLDSGVYVTDASGLTLTPKRDSYGYQDTEPAAGAFANLPTGQTKRVSIYYVIDESLPDVIVFVGDTEIILPVTDE